MSFIFVSCDFYKQWFSLPEGKAEIVSTKDYYGTATIPTTILSNKSLYATMNFMIVLPLDDKYKPIKDEEWKLDTAQIIEEFYE